MKLQDLYTTKEFAFVRPESGELYFNSACYTAVSMQALEAQEFFYDNFSVCAGRGADAKSVQLNELIQETRELIKGNFGLNRDEWSVVFTNNTTASLNIAINLIAKFIKKRNSAYCIKISPLSHNSLYLPALRLKSNNKSIEWRELDVNRQDGFNNCNRYSEEMVLLPYVDNVFGFDLFDYYFSGINSTKYKGIPRIGQHIILDGAQGALKVFNPSNSKKKLPNFEICSAIAFSGHKSHSTPLGVLLIKNIYLNNDLITETGVNIGGGNVSGFDENNVPVFHQDYRNLEAGLINAPAILSLGAWLSYLSTKRFDAYSDIISYRNIINSAFQSTRFAPVLEKVRLPVFDRLEQSQFSPQSILLIYSKKFLAEEIYYRLSQKGVIVRNGDFCVPFGFKKYNIPQAVRISMDWSVNNDKPFREVYRLLEKLDELTEELKNL